MTNVIERRLRRLIESIDLGVTRTEIRRLDLKVDGKVSEADVDADLIALNQGIKEARLKLSEAQAAAEENWSVVNDELSGAMDQLRDASAVTTE